MEDVIMRNGMAPETEVSAKAQRRTFTAEYKTSIVREADACQKPGEIGALLRREGLYSSHLGKWRHEIQKRKENGSPVLKRGPKADESAKKLIEQAREMEKLRARAERAELVVEIQKKVCSLLGISPGYEERLS